MRYYSINIEGAPATFGTAGSSEATYTSFIGGKSLSSAWNVEFDIPVGPAASPMGGALIRVWGISRAEISQSADLLNKKIKVFGGMQRGLPLANPAQAGLLVQGYVFQAYGNWIGTDMTLDLIVQPGDPPTAAASGGGLTGGGTGSYNQPLNLVLDWKKGTTLGDAIQKTLGVAFSGVDISVNVSSKLVRQNDEVAIFQTLTQFGQWARQMSKSIVKDANYNGVELFLGDGKLSVYDGTVAGSAAKQILFVDLIGQPTWIEAPTIQFKTIMRGDLRVGDTVKMPQTSVINTAQAMSSLVPNQRLTFQGEFMMQQIRHLGSFRQPDANSWVTVVNAVPTSLSGGAASGG